jgi:hypothetical protein
MRFVKIEAGSTLVYVNPALVRAVFRDGKGARICFDDNDRLSCDMPAAELVKLLDEGF